MIREEFKQAFDKVSSTIKTAEEMPEEKKETAFEGVGGFALTLAMGMLGGSVDGEEETNMYNKLEERFLDLGIDL